MLMLRQTSYSEPVKRLPTPVELTFQQLVDGPILFMVECDKNHELVLRLNDLDGLVTAQPLSEDEVHGGAVKYGVWLTRTAVDQLTSLSDITVDVTWQSNTGGGIDTHSVSVVFDINLSIDENAIVHQEFRPPDEPLSLSLFEKETSWSAVGLLSVQWAPEFNAVAGAISDGTITLSTTLSELTADSVFARLVDRVGHELPETMPVAMAQKVLENGAQLEVRFETLQDSALTYLELELSIVHEASFGSSILGQETVTIPIQIEEQDGSFYFRLISQNGKASELKEIELDAQAPTNVGFSPSVTIPRSPSFTGQIMAFLIRWGQSSAIDDLELEITPPSPFSFFAGQNSAHRVPLSMLDDYCAVTVQPPWDGRCAIHLRSISSQQTLCTITPDITYERQAKPGRIVAVDLGTSSICIGYTTGAGGAVEFLPLASNLGVYDPDHDEADTLVGQEDEHDRIISSTIGVFPAGTDLKSHWRRRHNTSSTWADGGEASTQRLEASVPHAPARQIRNGAGDAVLVATGLKMQALARKPHAELTPLGEPTQLKSPDLQVLDVYRAAFEEIGAFHLQWSGVRRQISGGKLILAHPNQFFDDDSENLRSAAEPLRIALDVAPEDVVLINEGRAALQQVALATEDELGKLEIKNGRNTLKTLVLDVGAGTMDATLGDVTVDGGRITQHIEELGNIGASVGGETIDLVLYYIIHDKLTALAASSAATYDIQLVTKAQRVGALENAERKSARRRVKAGIVRAKEALSTQISDQDGWPDSVYFDVPLGEVGLRNVIEPGQVTHPDVFSTQSSGGKDEQTPPQIKLRLSREEIVENPMMKSLMRFMCRTISETICADRCEAIDAVALTGRASQWPPLLEELKASVSGVPGQVLSGAEILQEHFQGGRLKSIVVEGAISMVVNGVENDPGALGNSLSKGLFERKASGWRFNANTNQSHSGPDFMQPTERSTVTHPMGLASFTTKSVDWRMTLLRSTQDVEMPLSQSSKLRQDAGRMAGLGGQISPMLQTPLKDLTTSLDRFGNAMTENDRPPATGGQD